MADIRARMGVRWKGRAVSEHDYEQSMAIAERALELMRAHHTPATPRNYELFYTYAAGLDDKLTSAFAQATSAGKTLTADDTQSLYDAHIAPQHADARIEAASSNLSSEINAVLDFVRRTTDSTEAFGESLKLVGAQLSRITDPAQVKALLRTLVTATKTMADDSERLKGRLAESRKQISELQENLEMVRVQSYTDPLTGVANRKCFDATLAQAIADAEESGRPLCLLMLDIDHFKRFNDLYGHQTGDGVLKLVARTVQSKVDGRNLLARYGGEEFAVVLPETPMQTALIVAEQMRRAVMGKELVRKSTRQSLGRITLSIGAAAFQPGESGQSLVQRADAFLYAAKHAGRNCVKSEPEEKRKGASSGAHAA